MLFILNSNGVPSVAKIVQIGSTTPHQPYTNTNPEPNSNPNCNARPHVRPTPANTDSYTNSDPNANTDSAAPTPSPTATATSNQAPVVNAGPDQTVPVLSATLSGSRLRWTTESAGSVNLHMEQGQRPWHCHIR